MISPNAFRITVGWESVETMDIKKVNTHRFYTEKINSISSPLIRFGSPKARKRLEVNPGIRPLHVSERGQNSEKEVLAKNSIFSILILITEVYRHGSKAPGLS